MADILKRGAEWLEGKRKAHMTSSVTYSRGADSVTLDATIGRTTYDVDRDEGITIDEQARDYIITVEDLVLAGVVVEPRRGDKIVEAASPGLEYEVMSPPGSEHAWRHSDDHRLAWRIHTKLVTVAP